METRAQQSNKSLKGSIFKSALEHTLLKELTGWNTSVHFYMVLNIKVLTNSSKE